MLARPTQLGYSSDEGLSCGGREKSSKGSVMFENLAFYHPLAVDIDDKGNRASLEKIHLFSAFHSTITCIYT